MSKVMVLAAACLVVGLAETRPVRAAETIDPIPLQLIEKANREVLRIQKESPRLDRATEAKLGQVFEPLVNFQEVAEDILEPYFEGWTIGEWRKLAGVLATVIRADSLWAVRPYHADRFEVLETSTIFRTVVVKLMAHNSEGRVPITYYLNRDNGSWYIVNYKVDDVALVEKYQEHYHPLFKGGFIQPIVDQLQRDLATHPGRN